MRQFIKALVYIVVIAGALVFCTIGFVDRTPLYEQPFYHDMMRELDTIHFKTSPEQKIKMGWGKFNITPSYDMPMAGYKPRNHFDAVHDSLYARIIAIDNGTPVFIISVDLLLFPPAVKDHVQSELKKVLPNAFVFFTATHTHNGLGGWNNSFAGEFITGNYHEEWVKEISAGIVLTMQNISKEWKFGNISYVEADATGYAANRLADDGKVDQTLRGIKFVREDSTKAILLSFSAHATSISKKMNILSGDYPTALNQELEKSGYQFALFAAGMVGSHRLDGFTEENFELTAKAGDTLASKILHDAINTKPLNSIQLTTAHIPLQYGSSQLRFTKNLKLRDWAFQTLLGSLKGEITFLELGDIILLGTPCDFSGELSVTGKLDSLATAKGKKLIITSFNGDYSGYITQDEHYDRYNKEEVMALNWVGPFYGQYFQEIIKKIVEKD